MYLVNKLPVSATGDTQSEPKVNSMWLRSISHITIAPVIILPFLMRHTPMLVITCATVYQKLFSYCVHCLVINAVQTVATMDKCEICSRKFQSHSHQIQCCVCLNAYHMKCISSRPEDLQKLTNERNEWYCPTCLSNIFPCNFIEDENDFLATITDISCLRWLTPKM